MTTRTAELLDTIEADMLRCKLLFALASTTKGLDKTEAYYFGALQCLTRAKTAKTDGQRAGLIMQARVAVKLGLECENRFLAESRKGAL